MLKFWCPRKKPFIGSIILRTFITFLFYLTLEKFVIKHYNSLDLLISNWWFSGADPKSIVCAFFKQGQCGKGDRCKFSHDLTIERKAEKRSMYVDIRDDEEDTMENWDEDKLKDVIEKKHGSKSGKMPTTDIVSYTID